MDKHILRTQEYPGCEIREGRKPEGRRASDKEPKPGKGGWRSVKSRGRNPVWNLRGVKGTDHGGSLE